MTILYFLIYFECIEDITEELKRIFPESFEYRRLQAKGNFLIANKEIKEILSLKD